MSTWSPAAENAFEACVQRVLPRLTQDGTQPEAAARYLRTRIEAELALQGIDEVSPAALEPLLKQLEEQAADPRAIRTPLRFEAAKRLPRLKPFGPLFFFFGVVYPLTVTLIELFTRMCANTFFDPMPTPAHILLVLLVPLSNLLAGLTARGRISIPPRALGLMLGVSVAAGAVYCLIMLPLLPLSFLAIIAYGIGLLTFAPYFGLAAGLKAGVWIRQSASSAYGWGFLLGLALLGAISFQHLGTKIMLGKAQSDDPDRSRSAIAWLRSLGSERLMQRVCYGEGSGAADFVWFQGNLCDSRSGMDLLKLRDIYYRVHGESYNTRPYRERLFPGNDFFAVGRRRWDADQGSDQIGGRIPTLRLAESRIDGKLDAPAGFVYYEWTQVFRNSDDAQAEARMQVELPHEAVVSRLTLWVNGEPREAVFAGRSQVRQAYQNVVRQRRDPVLVTTSGPDRVLVQCFPVPPNGGMMKIRFGITAPLAATSPQQTRVHLPRILERNFTIGDKVEHAVWIESHAALQSSFAPLQAEQPTTSTTALRGGLDDDRLREEWPVIEAQLETEPPGSLAEDILNPGHMIRVAREPVAAEAAPGVVLVVDGSRGVGPMLGEIAAALRAAPAGPVITLVIARDQPEVIEAAQPGTKQGNEELAAALERLDLSGGCDNLPGLAKGWDLATVIPGSRLLWLHGPQPLIMNELEGLLQRVERRAEGPRLTAFQLIPGPNRIMGDLEGKFPLANAARWGSVQDDLIPLLGGTAPGAPGFELRREVVNTSLALMWPSLVQEPAQHVSRLAARERIEALLDGEISDAERRLALELAVRYRLVTPVSGAVVLENDAQYRAAGLKGPELEPSDIPTIPEPEEWALMIVVTVCLALAAWFRRRQRAWRLA